MAVTVRRMTRRMVAHVLIVHVLIMREVRPLGDQRGPRGPILLVFGREIVPVAAVARLVLLRVSVDKLIRGLGRWGLGPGAGEICRSVVRDDVAVGTMRIVLVVPGRSFWRPYLRLIGIVGVISRRRPRRRFLPRLLVGVLGPGLRLVVPCEIRSIISRSFEAKVLSEKKFFFNVAATSLTTRFCRKERLNWKG